MKYAVETLEIFGYINNWTEDGEPLLFDTHAQAEQALRDHLADCAEAVEDGLMSDAPTLADFRIIEVKA
jgi:hypothetical protein